MYILTVDVNGKVGQEKINRLEKEWQTKQEKNKVVVTPEDISEAAKRYLTRKNRTIVEIVKKREK